MNKVKISFIHVQCMDMGCFCEAACSLPIPYLGFINPWLQYVYGDFCGTQILL